MRRRGQGTLYSNAVRSSSVITTSFVRKHPGTMIFQFVNTLNQAMAVQMQGSNDPKVESDPSAAVWSNVGASINVVATTGNEFASSVAAWKYMRAVITPGGTPTSGQFDSFWSWEEGA
jgi:hypothetical protein